MRISALAGFFTDVVIPRLPAFRDRYPDIELTMQHAATYADLSRKEADIAVRTPRPKQPNLVCRRAFKVGNAMYASRDYIERFGLPTDLAHAQGHFVARFADELDWVDEEKWLDRNVRGARVGGRASNEYQILELVRTGVGFGFIECIAGERDPRLTRLPNSPVLSFTYWLTAHEEAYKAPRVRVVLDWLADACRQMAPAYVG